MSFERSNTVTGTREQAPADRHPTIVNTHCRICEPQCALRVTVADGRIAAVAGSPDHVHSRGHLCVKAVGAIDTVYDPDRLLYPMKRVGGPGEFQRVSWDEALSDIVERLQAVRRTHGSDSFATFMGNPPAFGYSAAFWLGGFQSALDVKWRYGVNAEDAAARQVANHFLFGSAGILLKPDFWRTRFALILGANPFVSHGSSFSEPLVRDALRGIVARGGRVVVVDPRRSETARAFEHLAIRPGTDAWLLLGMIRTLFEEELTDEAYIREFTANAEQLRSLTKRFSLADCASRCGIPSERIEALARDFAAADSGIVYGRTGTCVQRFGTLANILQDTVNALTGNIEREGGYIFGWSPVEFEKFAEASGFAGYARQPTRVFGHPEVFGLHPSTSLVPDIVTPGPGQVRALMSFGANPVLSSAGGGERLEAALQQLDLHFSLDLYINESNRHAHYVLPVTHFYERSDIPFAAAGLMLRPSLWYGHAVIPPRGEVREEWRILQEIARRLGLGGAYAAPWMRRLARWGLEIKPETMADLVLRAGPAGDRFGLRPAGLNVRKLRTGYPNGISLKGELPIGSLREKLRTPDRRIDLCSAPLPAELERLARHQDDPAFPLRLIGMREIKSHNTWMHNSPRLMPARRRHHAFLNPDDAREHDIADGALVVVESKSGSVELPARVTTDIARGTVAIPHGWGHRGGWRIANGAGGANSNILASGAADDIEPLAAMSILSGVPIRVRRSSPS
jgi:formate dehydrogenase